MEQIGDRIKAVMQKQGCNQKEFAQLAGVTEAAMSHYVNNQQTPHIAIFCKIADAGNVSLDWLARGVDVKTIKCKDCKHYENNQKKCTHLRLRYLTDNDYCSWAERNE